MDYRIDSIAALARQMAFTPHDTLAGQLNAAEELLHSIDPAKAYPSDFIVFRITGYRAKRKTADTELLTGVALQRDLGLLIERLSEALDLKTFEIDEPILSIDDVTERFNVTSKTIQRWRRKGLPARRFTFPDGKRRVGFFLNSVERFIPTQREIAPDVNLAQVSDDERTAIIRRAKILARQSCCSMDEITRRIGRKLNRSPLTILHTIRKYEQENKDDPIEVFAPQSLPEIERVRIIRAYRKGVSFKSLADRFYCNRAAVYRALMDERIARLNRRKAKFIDDPLYHREDAAGVVEAIVAASADELRATSPEELRASRDLPAYLADLYRTPLLAPARERAMFLQFNFRKFQFVQARRALEARSAKSRELDRLENLLLRATQSKNAIVRANLRLVVSVARKHLRPGLDLMELISDGNVTLMRAVEGFDVHRGNRFSTYATLALMKGFARSVPAMQSASRRSQSGAADEMLGELADARHEARFDGLLHREQISSMLSRLDARERRVLLEHYGLNGTSTPATLEEVGQRMGLSRQRVRQIERDAIEKLRRTTRAV